MHHKYLIKYEKQNVTTQLNKETQNAKKEKVFGKCVVYNDPASTSERIVTREQQKAEAGAVGRLSCHQVSGLEPIKRITPDLRERKRGRERRARENCY